MIGVFVLVVAALVGHGCWSPPSEYRVGRVFIEGNTATPDWVILRLASFSPGQRVQPDELVAARNRLAASRWFQSVPTVTRFPNDFDPAFVDIHISVREFPGSEITWGAWEVRSGVLYGKPDLVWHGALMLTLGLRR